MRSTWLLLALAACASSPQDVTGPFSGPIHHFAIDRIWLPRTIQGANDLGDDLDHDGTIDNVFGQVTAAMTQEGFAPVHPDDLIGGGAIVSSVDIQADDLSDSSAARVWYYGLPGSEASAVGATISGGELASNDPQTTKIDGTAIVRLPVFRGADPIQVELDAVEIDALDDGSGGYDAIVRGAFPADQVLAAFSGAAAQAIAANPPLFFNDVRFMDKNGDAQISEDEVASSGVVRAMLAPDLTVANVPMLSVGYRVHLAPCDDGVCPPPPPVDPCDDRVRDLDETDVDCGGSACAARCAFNGACSSNSDCQSGTCAGGQCTAPSCHDGVRDGFETGVDTGGLCPD